MLVLKSFNRLCKLIRWTCPLILHHNLNCVQTRSENVKNGGQWQGSSLRLSSMGVSPWGGSLLPTNNKAIRPLCILQWHMSTQCGILTSKRMSWKWRRFRFVSGYFNVTDMINSMGWRSLYERLCDLTDLPCYEKPSIFQETAVQMTDYIQKSNASLHVNNYVVRSYRIVIVVRPNIDCNKKTIKA